MSEESKTHELKCWPKFYHHVALGTKTFEIRKNDRGFQCGDKLLLREFDPLTQQYSGRSCERTITYTTEYGQPEGYVVLALASPELEAARRDAQRYRWLRQEQRDAWIIKKPEGASEDELNAMFDSFIDAALRPSS